MICIKDSMFEPLFQLLSETYSNGLRSGQPVYPNISMDELQESILNASKEYMEPVTFNEFSKYVSKRISDISA